MKHCRLPVFELMVKPFSRNVRASGDSARAGVPFDTRKRNWAKLTGVPSNLGFSESMTDCAFVMVSEEKGELQ